MNTHGKLNERLAFSRSGDWVSMAEYGQVVAWGQVSDQSPAVTVTVQLRKATDSSGTNATDFGTAGTGDNVATAQGYATELGDLNGTPYTHVSATITDSASPDTATGFVMRGDGRFNP